VDQSISCNSPGVRYAGFLASLNAIAKVDESTDVRIRLVGKTKGGDLN